MKMSMQELDTEIGQIEARIAAERIALDEAINGCTNSLRNTVASPKTLLALTGIGYAMGKMMFGRAGGKSEAETAKKVGVLGIAAALNLVGAALVGLKVKHVFDQKPFSALLRQIKAEPPANQVEP